MKFGTIVKDGEKVDRSGHKFDIVIRNSRIIDPASSRDGPGSLYIRDGVIGEPVQGEAEADAGAVIDASGCVTVPGLVDGHCHVFEFDGEGGTDGDLLCIPNGVTTAVDGGSAGAANFRVFHNSDIAGSVTRIKALMNMCANGMVSVAYGENMDPEFYDPDEMFRLFNKFPDALVGVKVRIDRRHIDSYGYEPVRRAVTIANRLNAAGRFCIVQVHALHLPEDGMERVLAEMRPGDIFIHMYNPFEGGLLDGSGTVRACAHEARRRGVLFDCGGGRVLYSFATFRRAMEQGFLPDIISTDLVSTSAFRRPMFSLPHALTMYLNLGLSLHDVVKAATCVPAAAHGMAGQCGTLKPGSPADAAVFKLTDAKMKCFDAYGEIIEATRVLVPVLTIRDGLIRYRQTWFQNEL